MMGTSKAFHDQRAGLRRYLIKLRSENWSHLLSSSLWARDKKAKWTENAQRFWGTFGFWRLWFMLCLCWCKKEKVYRHEGKGAQCRSSTDWISGLRKGSGSLPLLHVWKGFTAVLFCLLILFLLWSINLWLSPLWSEWPYLSKRAVFQKPSYKVLHMQRC